MRTGMTAGVCPTLACADYLNLAEQLAVLDALGAESYHIDIMDGNFVPNYCLNFDYLKAVKKVSSTPCDLHLMTTDIERDIKDGIRAGADAVAFHVERTELDVLRLVLMIRESGKAAGLALSPESPVSALNPYLEAVDYIVIMAVRPGFSGQKFIESTYEKIRELDRARKEKGLNFRILIDGGIDFENAPRCIEAGADSLVAGALCIFSGKDGFVKDARRFFEIVEA